MAVMEAQRQKMKDDLLRLLKSSLYWLIISMGGGICIFTAYMDYRYRSQNFWSLAGGFWNRFGAVILAFVILMVAVRLYSVDYEQKTAEMILSTAHGRKRLFRRRMAASMIFAVISAALLAAVHYGVSRIIAAELPIPSDWMGTYLFATFITVLGGAGFSAVSGAICDIIKSHGATLCICGLPYGISFFINSSVVKPPDIFWFLRYGFFTELMRGRLIASRPGFWAVWYCGLTALTVALALIRRKERKEL